MYPRNNKTLQKKHNQKEKITRNVEQTQNNAKTQTQHEFEKKHKRRIRQFSSTTKTLKKRNNFLQKFLPIQEAGINEIKKVVAKTFTKTTQKQTLEKKTLGF
jgi:vacuolar-type H+-ATPase subunit E/Vma4